MPVLLRSFTVALAFLVSATSRASGADIPLDPQSGGRSILPSALSPGDLIFSTTPNWGSAAIRAVTNGTVSHVKIYVGSQIGVPSVVEAEPIQGVIMRDLDTSTHDDSLDVAFRFPGGLSNTQQQQVVDYALSQQGKVFDYWGAARDALFSFLGNPGYHADFDSSGQRTFYCSSLVVDTFGNAGLTLGTPNPPWSPAQLVALSWVNQLEYVGHLKYVPPSTLRKARVSRIRGVPASALRL